GPTDRRVQGPAAWSGGRESSRPASSSGWYRSGHPFHASAMAYIIERKDRFYVVAYDGIDPLTGRERRRWHPAGRDRHDAKAMAARIERDAAGSAPRRGGPVHLGEFLTDTWLPTKRRHVRASTSYRYTWMVDNYINPAIGHVPLRGYEPTTST